MSPLCLCASVVPKLPASQTPENGITNPDKKCKLEVQQIFFMKKVSDILKRKGNTVTVVGPETIVIDALRMMAEQNIGSVVVVNGSEFAGIVTERDYSRKVILKGKSSDSTTVTEIMSTDFPKIKLSDTIEFCMQQFSEKNIRYLPVFDESGLAGIISINDVVKEIILSQEETISSLKDYLHTNI